MDAFGRPPLILVNTYTQALKSEYRTEWEAAMQAEMDQFDKLKVY